MHVEIVDGVSMAGVVDIVDRILFYRVVNGYLVRSQCKGGVIRCCYIINDTTMVQ